MRHAGQTPHTMDETQAFSSSMLFSVSVVLVTMVAASLLTACFWWRIRPEVRATRAAVERLADQQDRVDDALELADQTQQELDKAKRELAYQQMRTRLAQAQAADLTQELHDAKNELYTEEEVDDLVKEYQNFIPAQQTAREEDLEFKLRVLLGRFVDWRRRGFNDDPDETERLERSVGKLRAEHGAAYPDGESMSDSEASSDEEEEETVGSDVDADTGLLKAHAKAVVSAGATRTTAGILTELNASLLSLSAFPSPAAAAPAPEAPAPVVYHCPAVAPQQPPSDA